MRSAIVIASATAALQLFAASSGFAQEILVHGFKNTFIPDGHQFANLQAGTDFGSVPVSGTSGSNSMEAATESVAQE